MKTILVVGAAGGLGSAVAAMSAARGNRVLGTVMNDAEAAAARAQVPAIASIDIADLAHSEGMAACIRAITAREPALDAIVVCAAIAPYGPAETTPLAVARRTFEINALSGLAIYQAAVPTLRANKGRIIFISSMAGKAAMPFIGAYNASKFALEAFADTMRRECRPYGVDIVLVEPGGIRTNMVAEQARSIVGEIDKLSGEHRRLYLGLYQKFRSWVEQAQTEGSSLPEDIAAIVMQALDAAPPSARYVAGADAQALIDLARASSDEKLDEALAVMFEYGVVRA